MTADLRGIRLANELETVARRLRAGEIALWEAVIACQNAAQVADRATDFEATERPTTPRMIAALEYPVEQSGVHEVTPARARKAVG